MTHCDLFFSDAAILVEGNVERLLLPIMISKAAHSLRSACICILEVGGAFGHKFKSLIEFLGIVTLIITDVDSVLVQQADAGEPDDEDEVEIEGAAEEAGGAPPILFGRKCLAGEPDAITSNQTLIQWLPAKQTIAELFAATHEDKQTENGNVRVRVAYQIPAPIVWNGATVQLAGRTLEEAFGLENASWCQAAAQRKLGLKLRGEIADHQALAQGLHRRVTGRGFDKTKFGLGVLTAPPEAWEVPRYIREGLLWLKGHVDLEDEPLAAAGGDGE